jgi:prepilin-type N-terminal cleavage/methylation domain-containing protein
MKKIRGFTLIELLIVVAIIAILAAIAVPNFLEAQVRAKVSRARTDMRSLAMAVEAYYVDNNIYPAWATCTGGFFPNTIANTVTYNEWILIQAGKPNQGAARFPCFVLNRRDVPAANFMTLTSPLSYITTYPVDPFASTKGVIFTYFSVWPGDGRVAPRGGVGWILSSFGPDVDEFKQPQFQATPFSGYNPTISQPSTNDPFLVIPGGLIAGRGPGGGVCFTYDPTNGTVSPGDLWRVKQ